MTTKYILTNDGRSLKPFELNKIEVKNEEELEETLEDYDSQFLSSWVLTEKTLKQLKEVLKC